MALVLNTEDNNTKVAKIPTFNGAATDAVTVTITSLLTEYKKTWQYLVQNRRKVHYLPLAKVHLLPKVTNHLYFWSEWVLRM